MAGELSLAEAVGKPALPLAASTEGTLVSLDPGRDILLDLLAAALNYELAPVWESATAATNLAGTTPVQDKVPFALTEQVMTSTARKFPVLSVTRAEDEDSALDEFTLWQWRLTQQWDVEYVLGPLTAGNERRLKDVLAFAAKVVLLTIRQGRHMNHESGAPVLGPSGSATTATAGFSSVRIVRYRAGTASFADNSPQYHGMRIRLETTELTAFAEAPNDLDGASFLLNPDIDEDEDPELYRAETEFPP
jgi:hypothetical protein